MSPLKSEQQYYVTMIEWVESEGGTLWLPGPSSLLIGNDPL